mmetsp:Transcript_9034/g.27156  ORF Transcript_9034/g.27156 Transcript_9034/m.27156 type:complete len:678 (-) Transcript_9034:583-2616(-)
MANAAARGELKTHEVTLFSSGVGHFSLRACVRDSCACDVSVPKKAVSDVLKTLTAVDTSGHGIIQTISYASDPSTTSAQDFRIDSDTSVLEQILLQSQGARVKLLVTSAKFHREGVIVGIQELQADKHAVKLLVLMDDAGEMHMYALEKLFGVTFLNEQQQRKLQVSLSNAIARQQDQHMRISVITRGEGNRNIDVGYAMECPVWKTSYRATMEEGATSFHLQGWAIVENVTDSDWEEIDLRLVSGVPISFVHDLYSARFKKRPVVKAAVSAGYNVPLSEDVEGYMDTFGGAEEDPDDDFSLQALSSRGEASGLPAPVPTTSMALRKKGRRSRSASHMAGSNVVRTQVQDVGQLFEYTITEKISIPRQQSALVPILFAEVEGKIVSVYSQKNHPKHSFRSVRMKNSSSYVLERGPVTVFENGSYAGEAMLNNITQRGSVTFLPFSMDLRVVITDDTQMYEKESTRVELATDGVAEYSKKAILRTYSLFNRSNEDVDMYLEHAHSKAAGYGLESVSTTSEIEKTESFYRFAITAAANSTIEVKVEETRESARILGLSCLSRKVIQFWTSNKLITDEMKAWLSAVREAHEERSRIEEEREDASVRIKRSQEDTVELRETVSKLEGIATADALRDDLIQRLTDAFAASDDAKQQLKACEAKLQEMDRKIRDMVDKEVPKS